MNKMKFDLSKYATVAERLAQAHIDWPDLRITTEIVDIAGDIGKTRWVVKSTLYLTAGDQANGLAKATGYAFEVDGTGGANATSALENCESSSIGRCLMVAGYAMNKDNSLASREEMQKVTRAQKDFIAEADKLTETEPLRALWAEAKANRAPEQTLAYIKDRANAVSGTSSVSAGASGGVSGIPAKSDGSATTGKASGSGVSGSRK
jgi:hypothetical protein